MINLEYPYNCLVGIESVVHTKSSISKKVINNGIGALIHCDLVFTCAHNIYPFIEIIGSRQEASEVWIDLGNRKVKVKDYRFPEEFKQSEKREFDYSLLLLSENVLLKSRYLSLASTNGGIGDFWVQHAKINSKKANKMLGKQNKKMNISK